MNQPAPARNRFWRFSLRELLLLVLAVGAFLGWGRVLYQHYRPFRATPVSGALSLSEQINVIRRQLGESDFSYFSSSGTGGGGRGNLESSGTYRFPLSTANYDLFAERLAAHVRSTIEANDCSITGTGGSASGDDFHMFFFRYRQGVTIGSLRLIVMQQGPGRGQALLFLSEHHQNR